MFCLYCGARLPDDAIFCNRCGKSQKDADGPSSVTSSSPPEASNTSNMEAVTSPPLRVSSQGTSLNTPGSKHSLTRRGNTILWIAISVVMIGLVVFGGVNALKLKTQSTGRIASAPPPTPDNVLCTGDTSGIPLSSGKIDQNHPFHEDDGQATQIDQGGFTPTVLCTQIAASSYAINLHAKSPYMSLYMYDRNHAKYEIEYNIYSDHILVVAYPGLSFGNGISVGSGTYSSNDWHTYQIEFTSTFTKVLVDGTQVLSGSTGFTDDGTGDRLFLLSHQVTMDQFSVTRI